MWSRYQSWLRARPWWARWLFALLAWFAVQTLILDMPVVLAFASGSLFASMIVAIVEYQKRRERPKAGSSC
jgi:uncharacterized membrane protein YesL